MEGYFVKHPFGDKEEREIVTLDELYRQANGQFSARQLHLAGQIVERYRQNEIDDGEYRIGIEQITAMTANPRLMRAYILYHPTYGAKNQKAILVTV